VEIEIADGRTAQDVLKVLVDRVSVKRFELVAPSLHAIFVAQVGGAAREQE
jgi:ABC-type uncharacterized transport system ATPase subunit